MCGMWDWYREQQPYRIVGCSCLAAAIVVVLATLGTVAVLLWAWMRG